MTESDDKLAANPFDFTVRNGRICIARGGTGVTTLGVKDSARFLDAVAGATEAKRQQLMARATGNYRRGNERERSRRSRRAQR